MYKKKVALNLEEIRGLISKLKLPTYQITDDTRSAELVVLTAEVDIEGLDQSEYLLCRTYFLMNLYYQYCIYDLQVIDVQKEESKIPDTVVLERLTKELWIAINAIRLRKSYEKLNFSGFASILLKEYQSIFGAMEVLDEIILPMETKKHAMYLALQKIDEKMVLIRIDDLGFDCEKYHQPMIDRGQDEVAPYVVDMLPIDKL